MTMNGVIALTLRYFTKFDKLRGRDYVIAIEDRLIRLGAEYPLPVIFWTKLTHAAVIRSLYDS